MKTLKFIILYVATALVVSLSYNASFAQTCPPGQYCIYVSNYTVPNFNASAKKGSEQNPYTTIQAAIGEAKERASKTVKESTFIRVFPGTYREKIKFEGITGTFDKRIVLSTYTYKKDVFLDGGGSQHGNLDLTKIKNCSECPAQLTPLIHIVDCSYIRVEFFTIQNYYGHGAEGIRIEGTGTFVELSQNIVKNIGWDNDAGSVPKTCKYVENGIEKEKRTPCHSANGIKVIGTKSTAIKELLIRDNKIHNCVTGYSESLTLVGNIDNFLVARNKVYDNTNIGIVAAGHYGWVTEWLSGASPVGTANQVRNGRIEENEVYNCVTPPGIDQSAGIYVDGGAYIQVRRNKSYRNGVGFSIGCEECKSSDKKAFGNILESNWAYENKGAALVLGSAGANITPIQDTKVFNNSFHKNTGAEIYLQHSNNSQIKQNIIATNQEYDPAIALFKGFNLTNLTSGYNLFWQPLAHSDNPNEYSRPAKDFYYAEPDQEGGSKAIDYGKDTDLTPANPNFVSIEDIIDLHLTTNSPAINQGDPQFNSSVTNTPSHFVDIDITPRIKGGRVDIGAHELR